VFFQGEALERSEGDPMPSETEFVASLGSRGAKNKVPVLEATPEQLARYPASTRPSASPTAPPLEPASVSYPPLEAPAR
jgi:outer membrane protein assembly factor BamE